MEEITGSQPIELDTSSALCVLCLQVERMIGFEGDCNCCTWLVTMLYENTRNAGGCDMGLINSIVFNDNSTIELDDDSIVVLVGPNNAGKSQSLKDIYDLCHYGSTATRVVKSIQLCLPPQEELEADASNFSMVHQNSENIQYNGYMYSFSDSDLVRLYRECRGSSLGPLRNFLISCLGTEGRLGIVHPPQVAGEFGIKDHPIQYLADSVDNQRAVSDIFQQAFGCPLTVDILKGDTLPLRLGSWPDMAELPVGDVMELVVQARSALATLEELQDQGDGMRSFTGIILNLLIAHCRAYVVDEPESFLHPPQAYVLGRVIGKLLGPTRQCILATHSRDIICGLLEACPQRVKVVRITRSGNKNQICFLDSGAVDKLWSDPILKYSNIMDAMFHESVVLCESDADCMMYSLVNTYISDKSGRDVRPLFVALWRKAQNDKSCRCFAGTEYPFPRCA